MTNMITSEEVNYLIFRYLQESGYTHSAFAFGHESHVYRSNIDGSQIPPGVLLSFLQRGLSYVEIEASLRDRDLKESHGGNKDSTGVSSTASVLLDVHRILISKQSLIPPIIAGAGAIHTANKSAAANKNGDAQGGTKSEPLRFASAPGEPGKDKFTESYVDDALVVKSSDLFVLRGHEKDIFVCSWNPRSSCLASGSGDGTARIWNVPHLFPSSSPTAGAAAVSALASPTVLRLSDEASPDIKKSSLHLSNDCTSLEWSPSGIQLATGSNDGVLRLWSEIGELFGVMSKHEAPIFCVRWSPSGALVATGSVDKCVIVWRTETKTAVITYKGHSAAVLDVSWLDDSRFASSSCDKTIMVHSIENEVPLKVWKGHSDDVNVIKWSPSGTMLASCSDDTTVRLWSLESDEPVATLGQHAKEVVDISWSPNSADHLLASASSDKTVIIWNAQTRSAVHTLKHRDQVRCVRFSPDGQWIATCERKDRWVLVWSVEDGTIVKASRASGIIYDLAWNATGDKLAASLADTTCLVFDPSPASVPMDKS